MKQRFSKRTRLVSALLTLAMVFTFLPFSAFAANTEIDFNSPDFKLNFPDAEFQRFLKERCDTNHNGKLDAQELSITEMTITDDYKIKNLEGIRFFEDLEKLDCHGIGLTTLNVGKNFKLRELDCSYNQLKDYLYILSSGLKILNCSHNNLTSMDLGILSGLKLEEVDCSYNKIWRIVMRSEEELIKFDCSNNELTALDVSRCYQLKQLNCSVNQLVELDVKNQTNLTLLDCHHNELIELNVSRNQNLASLTCDGNQLTTLDLSKNNSLSHLSCAENRLACVDFSHMVGSTINADGNRRPIAVRTDGKFDLATLPGFDVSKATNWSGGTVSGKTLKVNEGTNQVTYIYDCGKGRSENFTLNVKVVPDGTVTPPSGGDNPGDGSTPGGSTPGGGSTGGGDGGGAVVIVAAVGAVAAGVVGYGVYNYVSGQKLQALLPEGVAAPENRAQTALLLWNTAGRPEPAEAPAFADVADPDTAKAAQWCVEQGLMKRRLNGKFAPGSSIPAYQVLNAYRKLAG